MSTEEKAKMVLDEITPYVMVAIQASLQGSF